MSADLSRPEGLEITLGMDYDISTESHVTAHMPVTDSFRSRFGWLAGGATLAFIEHTAGRIVEEMTDRSKGELPFGTRVQVHHRRSALSGMLHSEATIESDEANERRRKVIVRVVVTDDDGNVISEGLVTNKIVTEAYVAARRAQQEAARVQEAAEPNGGLAGDAASHDTAKTQGAEAPAAVAGMPYDAYLARKAIEVTGEWNAFYQDKPLVFPNYDANRQLGIRKALDVSYSLQTPTRVEAAMPVSPQILSRWGFVGGGATLGLLETCAGQLATLNADQAADELTFGTYVDIFHRRSGVSGVMHGVATLSSVDVNERRRKIVCDVAEYDDDGNVISEGYVENKIVTRAYWEAKRAGQEG